MKREARELRTLWRAKLRVGTHKDEFLFREAEDFQAAAATAARLLESSRASAMAGAEIVAIERVARLWN